MQIYKRNIDKKLISLRLFLFLSVTLSTFLFINKDFNLFYIIATILLFCSLIVVVDFKFDLSSFTIVKYYFFGLIPVTWNFQKTEEIFITSMGTTFDDLPDLPNHDHSQSGLYILYGCIYPLLGRPKIEKVRFWISKTKKNGKKSSSISIFLTFSEYGMIEEIAGVKHGI